jgi:hypothetical protein
MVGWQRTCALLLIPFATVVTAQGPAGRHEPPTVFTSNVDVGGASLQLDFTEGTFDLPRSQIIDRVRTAAVAVSEYYGRFPVKNARIVITPVAGQHGVLQGTTWGNREGFPAYLRIRIGQATSSDELARDWIITHELVHTALASLPDDQHWLEEGLASYVEPIARVQTGQMSAERIWADMMHGMPNGEPGPGDRGLNHTHTWGRTYWGGALFCLEADIEIREQTGNRRGLQDALRAIVAAGGTIDKEWPIQRLLLIGDEATGTHVLSNLYALWGETPVTVDLAAAWEKLGVRKVDGSVEFMPGATMAGTRKAMMAPASPGDHPH